MSPRISHSPWVPVIRSCCCFSQSSRVQSCCYSASFASSISVSITADAFVEVLRPSAFHPQLSVYVDGRRVSIQKYNIQCMCLSLKQYYFFSFLPVFQPFVGLPTTTFYNIVKISCILTIFAWHCQWYTEKHFSMLEEISFSGYSTS